MNKFNKFLFYLSIVDIINMHHVLLPIDIFSNCNCAITMYVWIYCIFPKKHVKVFYLKLLAAFDIYSLEEVEAQAAMVVDAYT